eukprot:c18292_g1_i3.p1 GENE.c18292_g1_i3~~c18292_g1_i3.p1  ORF type:complete len:563 (+),score=93.12 c18292_g1_i3:30-1718(+)
MLRAQGRWLQRVWSRVRRPHNVPSFFRSKDISQSVNWSPEHEWALEEAQKRTKSVTRLTVRAEIFARILAQLRPHIFNSPNVILIAITGGVLLVLGAVEAALVGERGKRSVGYLLAYSWEQMLPSNVWSSKEPAQIVRAYGYDPATQLRVFQDNEYDSRMQLIVDDLRTLRYVVAGYMFMAQVLRIVNHTLAAGKTYRDLVLRGRQAPLVTQTQGRVIRVCGQQSCGTELSLRRYGPHIWPVAEVDDRLVAESSWIMRSVHPQIRLGRVPVYWKVTNSLYGLASTWSSLALQPHFCLIDINRNRFVCAEFDTSNPEDVLGLGGKCSALTPAEAVLGCRALVKQAAVSLPGSRVLRVYMGDMLHQITSGGGTSVSVRTYLAHDMDIMIDAQSTVLAPLLEWCEGVHMAYAALSSNPTVFEIDTDSPMYFNNARALLRVKGWRVQDVSYKPPKTTRVSAAGIPQLRRARAEGTSARIVYHSSPDQTVNAAFALVQAVKLTDDMSDTCIVVDAVEAWEELQQLKHTSGKRFELVCTAELVDDMLRQVKKIMLLFCQVMFTFEDNR